MQNKRLNSRYIILFFAALALSGCSVVTKRTDTKPQSGAVEREKDANFPFDRDSEEADGSTGYDQELQGVPKRPEADLPKVGLVLGPGGAKSFAHIGVITELKKRGIPVDAVIGMEWGSLVAALYSLNGREHEVQWRLYKLEKRDLPGQSFFSSGFEAESVDSLDRFLKDGLGTEKAENAKIPFACPSISLWSGVTVWQERGSLKKIVERCLPYPPMFKPKSPWMATAFAFEESKAKLKAQGIDVIIYIDVLGQADLMSNSELLDEYKSGLLWQEIKNHQKRAGQIFTEALSVQTRGISLIDFEKRKSAVRQGELAGRDFAKKFAEKYGF